MNKQDYEQQTAVKSKYMTPAISIFLCASENLLDGSNDETLPYDPTEGTDEALSNGTNVWESETVDDKEK
ncbi:MAG: hypothetical protein IKT00_10065 [Prevotella sp.]|nr:hypothetical protein [Prevotella sp.]